MKNCSYNDSTVNTTMFFKFILDHKNQELCFYWSCFHSHTVPTILSSEQICLELKILMSNFPNIGSSCSGFSGKKGVFKNCAKFIWEISVF